MKKVPIGIDSFNEIISDNYYFADKSLFIKDIIEDGKYVVVNSKFISTDGQVAKYSNRQFCPVFIDDILTQ